MLQHNLAKILHVIKRFIIQLEIVFIKHCTPMFWNTLITSFQCPNLHRATTLKNVKIKTSFRNLISPGSQLIIHQLTKFGAASCNSFRDIFITSFQWPNLQKAITWKKLLFLKFHWLFFPLSTTSRPSLKLNPNYNIFCDNIDSKVSFKRGITPQREKIQTKNFKSLTYYFFWMDTQTHRRMVKPKAIWSLNFSKVGAY